MQKSHWNKSKFEQEKRKHETFDTKVRLYKRTVRLFVFLVVNVFHLKNKGNFYPLFRENLGLLIMRHVCSIWFWNTKHSCHFTSRVINDKHCVWSVFKEDASQEQSRNTETSLWNVASKYNDEEECQSRFRQWTDSLISVTWDSIQMTLHWVMLSWIILQAGNSKWMKGRYDDLYLLQPSFSLTLTTCS